MGQKLAFSFTPHRQALLLARRSRAAIAMNLPFPLIEHLHENLVKYTSFLG